MSKEYKIDLLEIDERRREEEDNAFIKVLYELYKSSGYIDLSEYEQDEKRYELFEYATKIVSEAFTGCDCNVKSSLGRGGLIGTISILGRHIEPKNHLLFKNAVLSADSLELETYLDGNVEVSLTFFDMLKKVRDRSKN